MKKTDNRRRRWIFIIVGIFALSMVAACLGAYYVFFTPWYTAYEGPQITMENGQREVKFTTLEKLEEYLSILARIPSTASNARFISRNMENYKSLLSELENPPVGITVDFISNYHLSAAALDDEAIAKDVRTTQGELLRILTQNNYDIVGRESSWKNDITDQRILEENLETLNDEGLMDPKSKPEISKLIFSKTKELEEFDGVMLFKKASPVSIILGEEDKHLYQLNDTIRSCMTSDRQDLKSKAFCMRVDQVLIWLRTEIATAKVLRELRIRNLKRGAVVMGQTHRYPYEVLCRKLEIHGEQFNAVPLKLRGDEEY